MTTILATNEFIITDKRMSRAISSAVNKHRQDRDVSRTYNDHAIKICVEAFVRKLTYNGMQVMAISYAGSASNYSRLEAFMNCRGITTLHQVMAASSFIDDAGGIDIVAMCEDGSVHVIEMGGRSKVTHYANDRKTLVCKGSGSQSFRTAFGKLIGKGSLTLEEVFLYLTMNDSYSSNDYSVYSLSEDRLFTVVCPTHEHCRASALKVHSAIAIQYDEIKHRNYGI